MTSPHPPANADAARSGAETLQLPPLGSDVLLYDGVCALCNGFVRFLLARDRERRFRYAPLQGEFSRLALAPHGEDPQRLSTVFLIESFGKPDQRLLRRSRAVLAALRRLGGGWAVAARILRVVPPLLLDAGYGVVVRVRYSLFGRYDSCPLPAPEDRDLFLHSSDSLVPGPDGADGGGAPPSQDAPTPEPVAGSAEHPRAMAHDCEPH